MKFQLAENLGLENLYKKTHDPDISEDLKGLFPYDNPKNIKFAINFFTSIGLGALTEDMRARLDHSVQELQKNYLQPRKPLGEEEPERARKMLKK